MFVVTIWLRLIFFSRRPKDHAYYNNIYNIPSISGHWLNIFSFLLSLETYRTKTNTHIIIDTNLLSLNRWVCILSLVHVYYVALDLNYNHLYLNDLIRFFICMSIHQSIIIFKSIQLVSFAKMITHNDARDYLPWSISHVILSLIYIYKNVCVRDYSILTII